MTEPSEETRAQSVEVTCPGCFHPRTWDAAAACPICKYRPQADRSGALLPVGTQLKRYVIGEKLGQGGFGITHRGFDLKLHMKVAIKEYYPSDFAGRSTAWMRSAGRRIVPDYYLTNVGFRLAGSL